MTDMAKLKVGARVWKIMRDIQGVPIEIKQWTLTEIVKQPNGGRLDLHFRNGVDKEFAYAHHGNEDWFEFKSDARERARELFRLHEKSLNERLESLNKHRNRLLKPITSRVNWVTTG